ncbi:monovalent cation/H+ antiporter subunit F [Mycobacteroides saopaulense]|uniref:monovalent cation/H+ antiporter complex subunit F n=1 Tax=Mycobacteroides saopaulense TaxID=1578165 RepID=UPI000722F50F|nr:monovalent cation/H+ antiporter complex subunit F [Mycobacteroides saopaulense]ALR10558.1 monovalent cation/H+ antiporter subunit F [Mycobacteroides saopaulense]
MSLVWQIAAVLLIAAATVTMYRLLAGPNTLDRLVAVDTLVAVTMCALAAWATYSLDSTVLYGVVALSLISFLGSVSVTRFRVPDTAIDPQEPERGR